MNNSLKKIDEYPAIRDALPNEEPFTELLYLKNNLVNAKKSIYKALGFDQATVESLLTDLDIE